jgi:predicted phosphodiesterase
MTRLAVLADIHGNLPALEAVLSDLARTEVDQVVVAGDLINGGPFSPEVVERVLGMGWAVIRGNNELYLLDYATPRAPAHWQSYTLPPVLHRQLGDRLVGRIAMWPDALTLRFRDAPTVRVVHGSPRSHFEGISRMTSDDEISAMLGGVEETTVIAAHTHLALERRVGRWQVINPGTVGTPLDGTFAAQYALLDGDGDGWRVSFRRISYDLAPVFTAFERWGFVAATGVTGQLVIEEFRTARLHVLPFLRWCQAVAPDAPHDETLLARYLATADRWAYTPPEYHLNR